MPLSPRLFALMLLGAALPAQAIEFDLPFRDDEVTGVLNTVITAGAAWRMQERSDSLVGKSNVDPGVCGIPNQSCQATFRDQLYPSQALAAAAGQYALNADDGNLNYDRHELVQAPLKVTQDLTLAYGDFAIFARTLFFHDFINEGFTEYHPNRVTAENAGRVGYSSSDPGFLLPYPGARVYGPGEVVRSRRREGEVLRQAGQHYQFLDAYLSGKLPLPFSEDKTLSFKLGRQTVNWGESTLLVLNSITQAQPVNANNFLRVGSQTEEVFTPVGMAFASIEPFDGATLETFYQLEWQPVEAQTPGTFFSTVDVGSNNAGDFVFASFGGAAEDPDGVASLQYNPLARITNTTLRIQRVKDLEPGAGGQFGAAFKYYAENLNNGTELGFYFMNYHSRLPYASFFAADASCARSEGNALGIDAYDSLSFVATCPGIPQLTGSPDTAFSSAAALDSASLMLEYPKNIQLYGFSFNTTVGDYSIQGEVAYRPNLPLQVDQEDLVFAAYGPTLTRCHNPNLERIALPAVDLGAATSALSQLLAPLGLGIPNVSPVGVGCAGTTAGIDTNTAHAGTVYGPSDFLDANGNNPYPDTFDLAVGHLPGSARSFPNYVIAYRGGVVGENAPTDRSKPLDHDNPGYIRGYERFETYQFNLGGTRVLGATDNPFGADQILLVAELGATWVPDLPPLDQLQIEAPGTFTHASAGADGSGSYFTDATRRMACATNPTCSYGPDGLRFNPHQQDADGYTDRFSWGYRLISIIRYESVLPGISLQPTLVWAHDVNGTAPGPGENFVAGRKVVSTLVETRYKSSFSFNVGYTWFTGGGPYNLLRDRDYAQVYAKYLF
ncbi:MAG: DUF1302 family protein [Stagnimonas sp.]|nr:DUF1302 family protein [Stagnimonas sp.]